jgi:cyanophycin synthetase
MKILDVKALPGPNQWSGVPVLVVRTRIADSAIAGNRCEAGWRRRVSAWLPELARHAENVPALVGRHRRSASAVVRRFEQDLRGGIGPTQTIQYLAQILQMMMGVDARYGATRETDLADVFECAFQFEVEALARACLNCAMAIWRAAGQGANFDFAQALRELVNLADDVCLGPSTRAIVQAASRRGIPCRRLSQGSLVMLGEGKHQRRICTAETDATSAIAESIAKDKDLTKRLLHAVGIPVPRGRLVSSCAEAWQAACEIGMPVAVKPSGSNHAQGVSLNVFTREQLAAAFSFAQKLGADEIPVLIEQFIRGQAHRLLVVGGSLVAAARGQREYLVGDGQGTIRQLIDAANRDPRRGENYTDPLGLLDLEVPTLLELEKQGLTADSVPLAGQQVLLHFVGDYTTDCTEEVHPETAAQAVLAARLIGLDVAGIDLVADDIGQPLAEQRGAILEVNAGPALGMHVAPLNGRPRPVGEAIVARLFPAAVSGRIPIFVVTGEGDRPTNAQSLERLLVSAGGTPGRADRRGLYVAGQRIAPAHPTDFENAEAILLHPEIDAAVIEADGREAAERGLGCSRADVAIVACCGRAHGGCQSSPADRHSSAIAAVHAVPPDGIAVLPFSDWARTVLAPACKGKVFYYSHSDHSAGVDAASGVFWIRGNDLVLSRGDSVEAHSLTTIAPGLMADPALFLPGLCAFWLSGLKQLSPRDPSFYVAAGKAALSHAAETFARSA